MLEIYVDLYSEDDWRKWRNEHQAQFNDWRRQVVESVRTHGLVEPITNTRHTTGIAINEENLRETISVQEMNSRKRATLVCLEVERENLPLGDRRNPKILGTEALTRVGRILRGRFPYYLGTEYLPTEEEQRRHFPIPHVDLTGMDFADGQFDLFHSGDVFEHVPDLQKTLTEIARVLRPGGIAINSFPFKPEQAVTHVKARLVDGKVEHLEPPEIHGNPARPSEGSLVFSLPGWDILELCKSCGFANAKMTFMASSHYGVTSSTSPGVFVLSARKASESPSHSAARRRNTVYSGPDLRQIIGLMALPRSGTTLLSSVMGVHSRIKSVYEPWNDNKQNKLPSSITMNNFLDVFSVEMEGKPVLFVKETATHIVYINHMLELVQSVPIAIRTNLIYLLRNPLHVFLSEFEARKTWWEASKLELTAEVFDKWAERTITSLRRMMRSGAEFNPLLVSYEALVINKEIVIKRLTERLGLAFEVGQLSFEKTVKQQDVRGDPKLAQHPKAINSGSVERRREQMGQIEHLVAGSRYREALAAIEGAFAQVETHGLLELNSPTAQPIVQQLISALQ